MVLKLLKYDQKLCRVKTFFDAISALFCLIVRSLSKEEEKRNILKEHFRNLNLQKGVEIKPQKKATLSPRIRRG